MTLKAKLRGAGGEPLLGAFLGLGVPALVEAIGRAGFDYVILDAEHGAFSGERLEECVRAAGAVSLPALVRVPEVSPALIQAALDAGADGVQVPCVETAEQARRIVRASQFAPRGERGFGSTTRAAGYGFTPRAEVLRRAAVETVVVAQIETRQGLAHLDEICAVSGIDQLFFGTSDLSLDHGFASPSDPALVPVLRDAVARTRRSGLACGVHAADPSIVPAMRELGVGAFTVASLAVVARSLQAAVTELRRPVSPAGRPPG